MSTFDVAPSQDGTKFVVIKPSTFQQDIYDFITDGQGSCVVNAVAGSGKTTTIVNAARLIPAGATASFVAFNKAIALELATRLLPSVRSQTLNAMGYGAWSRACAGKLYVDGMKTRKIMDKLAPEAEIGAYAAALPRLVGLAKSVGIVPAGAKKGSGLTEDTDYNWQELVDFYELEVGAKGTSARLIELAREVLKESIADAARVIDFDDQLYMPVIMRSRFYQNDFLFVDEAQDVNRVQRAMLRMALKADGRLIAVGDPCQPAGTLVDTSRGTLPIEAIKVYDRVRSYQRGSSHYNWETVLKASKRSFTGKLYTVKSVKRSSSYTDNHWCLVNMRPLQNCYCTYIMRKGTSFRVGMCKVGYKEAIGPVTRMRQEGGDAIWVLAVHASKRAAAVQELQLSYKYHLPTISFAPTKGCGLLLDKVSLDTLWKSVRNGVTAEACLQNFNRNLAYPFAASEDRWVLALRRPTLVRACNLLSGSLVLHSTGMNWAHKPDWKPIDSIKVKSTTTSVYSLEISNTEMYIADGLVTHNCQAIYGFRGADHNAIDNIKAEFSAVELPLSISYRCPRSVVELAQKYVPHIMASDTAIEGLVDRPKKFSVGDFKPHDVVVCRCTAPVVTLAYRLIRARVACFVMGREIGQGLVALIDKMKASTVDELSEKLLAHREREVGRLLRLRQDTKAEALEDRLDTIEMFIEELPEGDRSLAALKNAISSLFSDNMQATAVKLMTQHKSKGLEADRVFILDFGLNERFMAKASNQQRQEKNLAYVAITRSKRELNFITMDMFK